MADPFRVLDDKIARLRVLVDLPDEVMPDVAAAMAKTMDRQIAAGTDPHGKKWPPRQDGEPALKDIAKSLRVGVVGRTAILRITDRHVVLHHFGASRGKVKRQVIPHASDGIPEPMARAIRAAIEKRFAKTMGVG